VRISYSVKLWQEGNLVPGTNHVSVAARLESNAHDSMARVHVVSAPNEFLDVQPESIEMTSKRERPRYALLVGVCMGRLPLSVELVDMTREP